MIKKHIGALTGIRGVAALWVLLHHLVTQYPLEGKLPHLITNIAEKGWLGVDLFFLLSGFVIAYVHHNDFSNQISFSIWRRFMWLRIARIYPVHLVTTLALIPIFLLASSQFNYQSAVDAFSLPKLLFSLSLTNGMGIGNSIGWNAPSWSVSSEFFAYLCFPFLAASIFRTPLSVRQCISIIGAIFILTISLGWFLTSRQSYFAGWEFVLLRVLSEFVVGMIIFRIYQISKFRTLFPVALVALAVIVLMSLFNTPSRWDWVLIIAFGLLLFSLTDESHFASRWLSSSAAVYLGKISYSVYLCHGVVFMVLNSAFGRLLPDWSGVALLLPTLAYVGISLLAAHIIYTFIEVPAQRWLKYGLKN
ncbi:acyltransferase family protein [Vibrio pectenicida]|uniref:Acyltransferase n=1 Tax=Vibrio pectenicida TaxID=62763 RepID=A0A427TXK3_9VIBR|nr:acyltransferase [Vibrio pectenicida]RSD29134.1 acyltransferase [Vibrio pectenicida]